VQVEYPRTKPCCACDNSLTGCNQPSAYVRIRVRAKASVSVNMVRIRTGTENSACHVYLSVPDGKYTERVRQLQ